MLRKLLGRRDDLEVRISGDDFVPLPVRKRFEDFIACQIQGGAGNGRIRKPTIMAENDFADAFRRSKNPIEVVLYKFVRLVRIE
ncbi:MAG: hypothetical protein H0T75_17730 [Rhizobiales bacterium]|nr:hypothetical protein [Hyphomicrobiales bacterium]